MEEEYLIVVSGSRTWGHPELSYVTRRTDWNLMQEEFGQLPKNTKIIAGGAKGADTMAKFIAELFSFAFEEMPADWKDGKAAGFKRNARMLDRNPRRVLCFQRISAENNSNGTANTISLAQKKGIAMKVHLDNYGKRSVHTYEGAGI